MSELQKTDKVMRVMAIIGGIIGLVESILVLMDSGLMPYGFGVIGGILGLIFTILVILLGIKPIHYTTAILAIFSILLIIFGILIGGIIILLAAFMGAMS